MLYAVLVFLHVLAAMGMFAAFAIESIALRGLRREPDPARLDLFRLATRTGLASMLALLGAGIALMVMVWHRQPWISAAFVGIAMMAIVGAVTARALRSMRAALVAKAASAPAQSRLTVLSKALVLRIAIAVGIVALMTAKPDGAGSALVLAGATLAGAAIALPLGSSRRTEGSAGEASDSIPASAAQ